MAGRREQQADERQGGDVEERYRHVRHHPVFGRRGSGGQWAGAGAPGRGAGSGPRHLRPVAPLVPVRPVQPERPPTAGHGVVRIEIGTTCAPGRGATRPVVAPSVTTHRRVVVPTRARFAVRRAMAGLLLVVLVALGVVVLGLVADAVSAARQPAVPESTDHGPGSR